MSAVNLKFIHTNVLRAAELGIPISIIFSEGLVRAIEGWQPSLRMEALSSVIALLNIVATTLEFSSVARSSDGRCHIPLNLYNVVVARSCIEMLICYTNVTCLFFIFSLWKKRHHKPRPTCLRCY